MDTETLAAERAALHTTAKRLADLTGFDYITAVRHVEMAQRQPQRQEAATAFAVNLAASSRPAGERVTVFIRGGLAMPLGTPKGGGLT